MINIDQSLQDFEIVFTIRISFCGANLEIFAKNFVIFVFMCIRAIIDTKKRKLPKKISLEKKKEILRFV